jgi:Xaa-Pro dipeptidase
VFSLSCVVFASTDLSQKGTQLMTLLMPVTKGIRHDHEGRVEKLRCKMVEQNVDGMYIPAGANLFYFAGFTGYALGWPLRLTGVVIPRDGAAIAFLNRMRQAIVAYADTWVTDIRTYEDGDDVLPILQQVMRDAGLATGRVGIEASLWSAERNLVAEAAPAAELVDFQDTIDDLRMIKDELEVSLIRKACEASMAGFKACHETAKVGTPGCDVATAVFSAMIANSALPLGGGSTASPTGPFQHFLNREMREGDVIACDLGGKYQNYDSDTSRTVFVGGITDDLNRIYDILMDSREQLFNMIRPGVRAEDVHEEACRLVALTGYDLQWRIGHGIGLGPGHEQPLLQYGSRAVLQPGMVFTIDPGIHYPHPERDLPIANEDVVLVTEDGYELLTPYPTKLLTD